MFHKGPIDQTRDHVAGGPGYDPDLVNDEAYLDSVYGHYGYQPYWSMGYMYPMYPWYPMSGPRIR